VKASIRGVKLYFDINGVGQAFENNEVVDRPSMFWLPGGPGNPHYGYKPQFAQLTDVMQLVFVDHRGMGLSEPCDPATQTLENNVDDIEALRIHLGLERIGLLGHSYGGMVAIGYAVKYPDRVSNLILSATSASYRFLDDAKRILNERATPEQIRACERLWAGTFENDVQLKEYFRLLGPMYSRKFDIEKFEKGWRDNRWCMAALNLGFATFMREFDYESQLHKIKCPTLVMAGAHDWICSPAQSRVIADRIPRAHLKLFKNSAHSIATDETEAYMAAVRGFMTYAAV
jgi:proline iminopeptidase